MEQPDLEMLARTIIDSVMYLVLGTSDESGRPWVSPVYFASQRCREFYWMSSRDVTHSRNILVRPQVSIVIFDSRVAVGTGQAVYMTAIAGELAQVDINRGVQIYNGRFRNPAAHGVRTIKSEDVQAPALYRLYRAIAQEYWVLDPNAQPDQRIQVAWKSMDKDNDWLGYGE